MKKPEKLYEGNIRKKYFWFALPLILSSLLLQSYAIINSMMIGKFIGSEAFAATAVTQQFTAFVNSIFFGYLTGVGIYVSVLFGKGDYPKVLNVIKLNFLFTSISALLVTVAGNVFYPQLFDALNVGADVYQNAAAYFRVHACSYLFLQFNWGFIYISNGLGMPKLPLTASIVSGVLNVAFNYLFLGVLGKGIGYSALATLIATGTVTVFYFISYIRLFRSIGVPLRGFSFNKEDLKKSFSYGAPSMFQQMAMSSCTALASPLTNTCPTAAISGYAIANKAQSLICAVYQDSTKANTNFIAQAMGAKKLDKIKQGIKIGITQGLAFFGVTLLLFVVFAKPFTGLFLDPVEDAVSFTVSVTIIRFLLPLIFFNVFNNLFHGIFRAVGSGTLMFISTLIYAVSFVIYAYTLFHFLPQDLKIYGVHLALGAAYITEVIFATVIYVTGKWKTPEYKALEAQANT